MTMHLNEETIAAMAAAAQRVRDREKAAHEEVVAEYSATLKALAESLGMTATELSDAYYETGVVTVYFPGLRPIIDVTADEMQQLRAAVRRLAGSRDIKFRFKGEKEDR